MAPHLNPWFLFTAALVATVLGALDALELAGHGTAVSVWVETTARRASVIFALGTVGMYASRYLVPEPLYPGLAVLSGITIILLGGSMLLQRPARAAINHKHGTLTRIPCPAALTVLLSALAFHRMALGFFLIAAFSLGLVVVLIGCGIMEAYARRSVSRFHINRSAWEPWLPMVSATFIALLGCMVAYQGLAEANLHLAHSLRELTKARLGPLLYVIGLGLILGMRHSTDADHVVAISTIVSKQRSIRGAAFIGSVWGIGHTITIFIVGSLIILFGIAIPPRLGLSMEFCVALMLVLLGLLNLTGILGKFTERFTPKHLHLIPAADTVLDGAGRSGHLLHRTVGRFGAFHVLRPLVIGLVHGLAGSAAVALLVLSTIHNPMWATFYLLVFGAGTMVGMMCMTAAMAVPFTYAGERFATMSRYLNYASGVASLCFGSFLVYQLGYVGNLFGSHPLWTPQ